MSTTNHLGERPPVYLLGTTPVSQVTPDVVGAKAFNLMQMEEAGLPVPPAFVLGTSTWREFQQAGGRLEDQVVADLTRGVNALEELTGRRFGAARRPLLVSVRSGAAVSMPGMLQTILNVGLSEATLPGLLRSTGDPVFVWDSYRRLVQGYAEVVDGCPSAAFSAVLDRALTEHGVADVAELDVAALKAVVRDHLDVYRSTVGRPFPDEPMEQLVGAAAAVLRSWDSPTATEYRALQGLSDAGGTAVTIQAMVFGNMGATSGSGVGFTRDPSNGANQIYVDFLLNAQGEDVVAGRQNIGDTEAAIAAVPDLAHQLQSVRRKLEALFGDAQEFEFTVEEGQLWMLQARTAKRTGWAALQIACDLVEEGLIDPATAVERLRPYDVDAINRVRVVDQEGAERLGGGVPAGGDVVSGRMALTIDAAQRYHDDGDDVVLVRDTASTGDVAGMAVCRGIVTATGARTSHAAVVARQLGLACIVGCSELVLDLARRTARVGEATLDEGEVVAVDGSTGSIYRGVPQVRVDRPDELVARVHTWQAGPTACAGPPVAKTAVGRDDEQGADGKQRDRIS